MTALTHITPGAKRGIQLYGWDSRTGTWSGPTGLGSAGRASKRLLNTLRTMQGRSWFGALKCASPGEPEARFFVVVHDLQDCAVAMVYCGDSKTGPAEVLAVIPAELRPRLRPEFAFEFLAFSSFLGAVSESAAITVHDRRGSAGSAEQGQPDCAAVAADRQAARGAEVRPRRGAHFADRRLRPAFPARRHPDRR